MIKNCSFFICVNLRFIRDLKLCGTLDVHVKQYDMCMWDSTTCTSHAALHVHLKQDCAPGKGMFLSKKTKVQHRVTVMMPFKDTSGTEKYAIIFVTNQIGIKLRYVFMAHR